MAVTLIGSDSLFVRLGGVIDWLDVTDTAQTTVDSETTAILDQYTNDRDLVRALSPEAIDAIKASFGGSVFSVAQSVGERTVVEMVNDDNPQPDKTLYTAMVELILQMNASSSSVDANEISESNDLDPNSDNTGNGNFFASYTSNEEITLENVRDEDITLTCITDRQVSGTSGTEIFRVRGEAAVTDRSSPLWPAGSGYSADVQVTNAATTGTTAGKNLLTNGAFETFTVTDTPDSWTIAVGAAGADVTEEGTVTFRGSKALAIVGDASTLTKLTQAVSLKPKTKYLAVVHLRKSAGLAAGVLRFSVRDGGGTVMTVNGTASEFSVAHGSMSSSQYDDFSFAFSTTANLPATTNFVLELTTAATSGQSVYVDEVILTPMHQLGALGAPYFIITAGSTDWVLGDDILWSPSNTHGGEFQDGFDRMFGMYEMGLVLPSNGGGSETIDDALVS